MKKLLGILIIAVLLVSCESQKTVQTDIDELKVERATLKAEVLEMIEFKRSSLLEVKEAREYLVVEIQKYEIYESGKTPNYILRLRLKQSHFSLDIGKHMKDSMNAIEFELPVDEKFYKSVKLGTNIVDEFRSGSLLLNGSFGSWKMTVVGKEIR